jgi:hypothetical protein
VHASVPYAHAQHALKGPFKIWNFYAYAEDTGKKLMLCLGYASVPDSYAQQTHQFLTRMLRVRISSWCVCSSFFEGNALCARISTWRVISVHAPVPESYAQRTHQFLTRMISARISSWHACSVHQSIPYSHAEGIQNDIEKQENWCACWACA